MTITGIGRIGRRKKARRGGFERLRGLRSILAESRPEWDLSYGVIGSRVLHAALRPRGVRGSFSLAE